MYELPDEIWNIIKSFTFDWKKYHKIKLQPILKKHIDNRFKEIYKRWTSWPIPNNTNSIIENEFVYWTEGYIPRPNLPLTSITYNITGKGGWWAGYGWEKNNDVKKNEYLIYKK